MKEFNYCVTAEEGLHARPAKELVKKAGQLTSEITLDKLGRKGSAKKIFSVMSLGVKKGEEVHVMIEGQNEEQDCAELKSFFHEHL